MRVLITGGGTGGHLFPGIALAEEIVTRHPQNEVVFVGTARGLEAHVVPANGFVFEAIISRGLKRVGFIQWVLSILTLPASLYGALSILRRYRPDIVVGLGGYSSGPVVLTAWLLRIPTALQEQNAVPGLTNKILARFVNAAFVACEQAKNFFSKDRTHLLGNPIRRGLLEGYLHPKKLDEFFTILVIGGSLGASGLNARFIEALDYLAPLQRALKVIHQTGKSDLEYVRARYARKGFQSDVCAFIDDIASAYLTADLVIARAGASTLAELAACRKAAILIPFPYAAGDHQTANAQALADVGAALVFQESTLTGEKLAQAVMQLKSCPEKRASMERASGRLARLEAAQEIADVLQQLCLEKWGSFSGQRRKDSSLCSNRQEKKV